MIKYDVFECVSYGFAYARIHANEDVKALSWWCANHLSDQFSML